MLLVVQFGRVVSFPRRTVVEEMRGDAESSTQAESETMEELGKTNGGDESEAAMTQAVAIWSRFSNWMDTLASFYSTGAVHVVCMRYADKSSVAIPGDQHHGSRLVDMKGGQHGVKLYGIYSWLGSETNPMHGTCHNGEVTRSLNNVGWASRIPHGAADIYGSSIKVPILSLRLYEG